MTLSPAQRAFRAMVQGGRRVAHEAARAVHEIRQPVVLPVPDRLTAGYWADRAGAWMDEALAGLDQDGERRDPH